MTVNGSRLFFLPTLVPSTLIVIAFALSLPTAATANDFYAGKTIDLIVGGSAGGGHDAYARTIARHLPRYISGAPAVVVKNMPGAGSMRAAGYVYSIAPKDGTTIAAVYPGAIVTPLLDAKSKAQYEPTKLNFIGSAENGARICATYGKSKIKTFADVLAQDSVFAGSAPGAAAYEYGYMLRNTTGAKVRVIAGYKATRDMILDMERGEVDGLCGWDWSTAKTQRPGWIRDKTVNILVQFALEPNPELAKFGVPLIWNFIKNEDDRKAVKVVVSQQVFSRPYIAAPETPAAQLKILREAYAAVMTDKQFLADAEKSRLDISPSSGAKLQELVRDIYATPQTTVDRARKIIAP
jgi:tripartite-type tricarboxylate transporter receptor subunit TctC